MKATGIVRRLDDLGRISIPREVRDALRLHLGDKIEIFVEHGGKIILKKFSPLEMIKEHIKPYLESIYQTTGYTAYVTDWDNVIYEVGAGTSFADYKKVCPADTHAMEEGRLFCYNAVAGVVTKEVHPSDRAFIVAPITSSGEVFGAVALCSRTAGASMGEVEIMLVKVAADFLGRIVNS